MRKPASTRFLLSHAVLTSSIFVAPIGYANFVVQGVVPGPISTNGQSNETVEIASGTPPTVAGQVSSPAANGINLDSIATGGTVLIDPGNFTYPFTAITVGNPGIGINVSTPNGTIDIGAVSGISNQALNTAPLIYINANNTKMTNAGNVLVNGTNNAIQIDAGGTFATVTNNIGGNIFNTIAATSPVIQIKAGGTNATLANFGTVSSNAAVDAIEIGASFISLTNGKGGSIQQSKTGVAGNGITLDAAVQTGYITNYEGGFISVAGTGNAINVGAGVTLTGAINNAGVMGSASGDTILLNNLATLEGGLINSGDIINSTLGNNAINMTGANATFMQSGGIVHGNVLLASFDSNGGSNIFNMTGGAIDGKVIATNNANSNTLSMSGGTITQYVQLGKAGDTFNLSNTADIDGIFGDIGGDTLNISGGNFDHVDLGPGRNTANINGTFTQTGIMTATGGTLDINVNNPGTVYTVNSVLGLPGTGTISKININAQTTMIPNSTIYMDLAGGTVTVLGTLYVDESVGGGPLFDFLGTGAIFNTSKVVLADTGILNITAPAAGTSGIFTNGLNSTLMINTYGVQSAGGTIPTPSSARLVVNDKAAASVLFTGGSFVAPTFSGFMPEGTVYDVVEVNGGGTISGVPTITQPSSTVVYFTDALNTNNTHLLLTAHRRPYQSLSSSKPTQGVAGALDVLALGNGPTNNDLFTTLVQLDQLATQSEVEDAMESLTPPFNYGEVMGSKQGMNEMFNAVTDRMADLTWYRKNGKWAPAHHRHTVGFSAGDGDIMPDNLWVRALGSYAEQSAREEIAGYKVRGAGLAIGADFLWNDCAAMGAALNYYKSSVADKNFAPKDSNIQSWQGTLYGYFDFSYGLFLDTMVAVAANDYKLNRTISVNNIHTGANASYDGTQWGAQGDLGIALSNCGFYYAPFVRAKWIQVSFDDYTERGAGDLSLTVHNNDVNEFMGGVGIKLATVLSSKCVNYIPEVTMLLGYDFTNDGTSPTASFIGAGPAFGTDGVAPGSTIFDLGLGLNVVANTRTILTFKYDMEIRDEFWGNAGYIQYSYLWC